MGEEEVEKAYFSSYGDLAVHREMISDKSRMTAYKLAILRNYDQIYGKVVADVGAGTGILSLFCVQAGAKRVYAIEASAMATQIGLVTKSNNMAERITVVHGKVEDVDLPEKVDVIVSEWMGYFLLFETMLPSVLLARDRWLKPGGLMLPEKATLFLAPFCDAEVHSDTMAFWSGVKDMYKVDLSALTPYALRGLAHRVHVRPVLPEEVVAHSQPVLTLDLLQVAVEDIAVLEGKFHLECFGYGTVHGFVSWFSVEFRKSVQLSTSPYEPPTHWQQSLVYVDEPFLVAQDTCIAGSLRLAPQEGNKRFLKINVTFDVKHRLTSLVSKQPALVDVKVALNHALAECEEDCENTVQDSSCPAHQTSTITLVDQNFVQKSYIMTDIAS